MEYALSDCDTGRGPLEKCVFIAQLTRQGSSRPVRPYWMGQKSTMQRRSVLRIHPGLALLPLLAACAVNPRTAEIAPPTAVLAYSAAAPDTLLYDFADTTNSAIQGGAIGQINVNIGSRGTVAVELQPAEGATRATVRLTDFSGTFRNSAGGGEVTAAASDVRGPAVVTLTPRGAITSLEMPQLTQQFRNVAGSENVFRRLFLRLPGGPVTVGTAWQDTIVFEETNEGVTSRTRNVVRSAYARDTTVAGRKLAIINTIADRTIEVSGVSQGIDIRQNLQGTATGVTLWDPEAHAIISRQESVDMRGTFDLPGMGMSGMPITATGSLKMTVRAPSAP